MKKNLYKPEFIYSDIKVVELLKKKSYIKFIDAYESQLKELFVIENTDYIGNENDDSYTSKFRTFKKKYAKDYLYVYYPWNESLVKCIRENEYFILKTNRNQDLITLDEQRVLHNFKVGIFGMSVGSNIAFVMTQAGISKNIVIADFDRLETTNLNRIWAGVHQVGLNKCMVASHRIYEDNPYANVKVYDKGISVENLEQLLKTKMLECIVEEIDNMNLKIEIRKLAMKYKVPVLMITDNGDWGVLHVERYDLGYKKIFEKEISYWNKRMSSYSGKKDFADIVINQIVGGPEKVDPRMLMSAKKVMERKLVSWPQLGSAALLGGIAVTVAIKNIIRNDYNKPFYKKYLYPLSEK